MLKLVVLTTLLATCYARNFPLLHRQGGRIAGGEPADITEAPYQVALALSLSIGGYTFQCGGSLIAANVVLSAAHCTKNTADRTWRIRAGSTSRSTGGVTRIVSQVIDHPDYKGDVGDDYDLTVLILSSPFELDNVKIALISLAQQDAPLVPGTAAFVTGWGLTSEGGSSSTDLRKITVPLVEWEVCNNIFMEGEYANITERMFCAGDGTGKDACSGDSGGPLAINGVLYGVVSSGAGCAEPGYPGVYTSVPYLRNWIDSEMPKH